MSENFDLSKYSDDEILSMLKQKQKEYFLLIQSEKVAKMILDYYGEEFLTSKYHYRVNSEYYLIYEKAAKKNLNSSSINYINGLGIPTYTVIARLEDSRDELKRNSNQSNMEDVKKYFEYSRHLDDIIDNIKLALYYKTIIYRDGYLYFKSENEETLITKESIKDLFENQKKKTR